MRPRTWVYITLALLIFTTILQIAGLVSPMWIWLQDDDYVVAVGLYYRVGCGASSEGVCTDILTEVPFGYGTASTYDETNWVAVVWLETISACLALLLCIMMIVYAIGFGVWKKMGTLNWAMVLTCILSWMCLVAGLVVFLVFHSRVLTRSPDISRRSFPWSLLMCFFAAIFLIIITLLIRFRCRKDNYIKNAIPTSADSKMALNPSTKNQLMKRYFTPSPYREDRRQALYSSAYEGDENRLIGSSATRRAVEYSSTNGFTNPGMLAIDYQTPPTSRKTDIISQNFSSRYPGSRYRAPSAVSTTMDNGDNNFRGTIFENDLGTSVRENTYGNTRIIERKYVTRTDEVEGNGAQMDRGQQPTVTRIYGESQQQLVESQRQVGESQRKFGESQGQFSESQRKWGNTVQSQVEDRRTQEVEETRVVGHESYLDRNRHDEFSDIDADNTDAETIYYTGREDQDRPGLSNVDVTRRDTTYSQGSNGNGHVETTVVTRDIITQSPPPAPPLPVAKEQVVTEITVIEGASKQGSQKPRPQHYRLTADQDVTRGVQESSNYTVHTRTKTSKSEADEVILTPGQLSGDKFKYNGTYIYRPYSEEIY